ncbi:exported hypothetical protein [uncultured Paludibacter sp.]|nr:exported hypothetical protein [uncultured Paludibacter sp.]
MKHIFISVLLLVTLFLNAQNNLENISKALNSQLKKELKKYPRNEQDSFQVLDFFKIDSMKNLSLRVKWYNPYIKQYTVTLSEVPLEKITTIGKDINVVFFTEENSVKTTTTQIQANGKASTPEIIYSNMFFTEINKEQQNRRFRDKIIKIFKKAGYEISFEIWYD